MYFLSVNKMRLDADPADFGKVIALHIQWTKERISDGTIVQSGKWGETGGVTVIKAGDLAEAQAILNDDPLVRSNLIHYELDRWYPDVEIKPL